MKICEKDAKKPTPVTFSDLTPGDVFVWADREVVPENYRMKVTRANNETTRAIMAPDWRAEKQGYTAGFSVSLDTGHVRACKCAPVIRVDGAFVVGKEGC